MHEENFSAVGCAGCGRRKSRNEGVEEKKLKKRKVESGTREVERRGENGDQEKVCESDSSDVFKEFGPTVGKFGGFLW